MQPGLVRKSPQRRKESTQRMFSLRIMGAEEHPLRTFIPTLRMFPDSKKEKSPLLPPHKVTTFVGGRERKSGVFLGRGA